MDDINRFYTPNGVLEIGPASSLIINKIVNVHNIPPGNIHDIPAAIRHLCSTVHQGGGWVRNAGLPVRTIPAVHPSACFNVWLPAVDPFKFCCLRGRGSRNSTQIIFSLASNFWQYYLFLPASCNNINS